MHEKQATLGRVSGCFLTLPTRRVESSDPTIGLSEATLVCLRTTPFSPPRWSKRTGSCREIVIFACTAEMGAVRASNEQVSPVSETYNWLSAPAKPVRFIVRRTEFGGYPLRVEYDLTAAGERLVPLIDAIGDWWESTEGNIEERGADNSDIADSDSDSPRLIAN